MERDDRPAEGWSGPDDRGIVHCVEYGPHVSTAPDRPGYEVFYVGIHGDDYTRWAYRPANEETPHANRR